MWWLLIAAAVVAALSTFIVLRQQPAVYQQNDFDDWAHHRRSQSFIRQGLSRATGICLCDVANRKPIQEATMKALGLNRLPEYYAQVVPNGIFRDIRYRYESTALRRSPTS
jgi:hypothetical protein